jgi:hypothetical protein
MKSSNQKVENKYIINGNQEFLKLVEFQTLSNMNLKNLISELIDEVAYRSNEGLANLQNIEHIRILAEVLDEWGYSHIKNELISNLLEVDDEKRFSNPILRKSVKYTDENGEDKEGVVGDLLRLKKDTNGRKAAEKLLPDEGSPERKEINKELGSEKDGATKTTSSDTSATSVEKSPEEKQQTANMFSSDSYNAPDLEKKSKQDSDSSTSNEQRLSSNSKNIRKFIEVGFDNSKGAPGNKGSMLNETTSILSATDYLNKGEEFNYDSALEQNVNLLKGTKLGEENDGETPAGRVKMSEAKLVAQQYGISVGLAAKVIIATRAAKKKHDRVKTKLLEKNNITNFDAVPLFGDARGLETQRQLVNNTKGEIKLGNKTITKEEALEIINAGGGGKNPSDTAIFVVDKDTGNLHMTFFSDKDATNALVAQSSLTAENELKKEEINTLVKDGILTEDEGVYYKSQMDTAIKQFQELEESLSNVVNGPGKHLESQNVDDLTEKAKNLSAGSNPEKYWKKAVVAKFTSTRNPAYKTITPLLPEGHSNPPTDKEMMEAYVKWINLEENQGNLSKDDQRVVTDLSNQTDGPKLGSALGEIRKKSVAADLSLIKKLDEKKVTVDGKEVGLGTYLEAKSVSEKLHLDILFGGEGVYQDEDAFCQENGGVTVTKEVMEKCLPFKTKNEMVTSFEVGEEVDQVQRGGKTVTGGSKIVYAVTSEGNRYPLGEKKQRSKQGPLGKLSTVYNFHPELQKCFDKHGK